MDVFAHAIGQFMATGYAPNGVVLNGADYAAMRLLKMTIGSYIFMGEGGSCPDDETVWEKAPLVWQVPMVVSPSMAAASFLGWRVRAVHDPVQPRSADPGDRVSERGRLREEPRLSGRRTALGGRCASTSGGS
jgi:hypothetical protein